MNPRHHGSVWILIVATCFLAVPAAAGALDTKCSDLTANYRNYGSVYEAINEANTSDVAPADFYDTVACECRLKEDASVKDAVSKALAASKAGLWAAEPMHHDLSPQERKEASAFANWMRGYGPRPTMHGVLACAYTRADVSPVPATVQPASQSSDAGECIGGGEETPRVLTGTLVEAATTEANDGTGEPAGTKFIALALDKPICLKLGQGNEDETLIRLVTSHANKPRFDAEKPQTWTRMLGQHVKASGAVNLDETLVFDVTAAEPDGHAHY